MIEIRPQDIKGRPKVVGKIDDRDLFLVSTLGGWHMIVAAKNGPSGKFETLGAGPHRAMAMHIAEKQHPGVRFNQLSKADYVDPACFAIFLPQWERVTDMLRKIQGF